MARIVFMGWLITINLIDDTIWCSLFLYILLCIFQIYGSRLYIQKYMRNIITITFIHHLFRCSCCIVYAYTVHGCMWICDHHRLLHYNNLEARLINVTYKHCIVYIYNMIKWTKYIRWNKEIIFYIVPRLPKPPSRLGGVGRGNLHGQVEVQHPKLPGCNKRNMIHELMACLIWILQKSPVASMGRVSQQSGLEMPTWHVITIINQGLCIQRYCP